MALMFLSGPTSMYTARLLLLMLY